MNSALWVSKTGLAAQDMRMTTISNNLANVNTVGFKKIGWCLKTCFIRCSASRARRPMN